MITWGGIFEKNQIENQIKSFHEKTIEDNFWNDNNTAQKVLKKKKFLETIVNDFKSSEREFEDLDLDIPEGQLLLAAHLLLTGNTTIKGVNETLIKLEEVHQSLLFEKELEELIKWANQKICAKQGSI